MMRRHHNENYFGAAIKISCGRVTRNKNITNSGLTKYHFYYNNNTKSSQPSLAHDFHSWNQWSCIFQFATILLTGFLRSEQQLFPCTRHSYTLSMATEKAPTTNEAALKNLEQQLTCPVCLDHYTQPRTLPCLHSLVTWLPCSRRFPDEEVQTGGNSLYWLAVWSASHTGQLN